MRQHLVQHVYRYTQTPHTHIHIHTHAYAHACTRTHTHTYTYTHTHTRTHTHTHTHTNTHTPDQCCPETWIYFSSDKCLSFYMYIKKIHSILLQISQHNIRTCIINNEHPIIMYTCIHMYTAYTHW